MMDRDAMVAAQRCPDCGVKPGQEHGQTEYGRCDGYPVLKVFQLPDGAGDGLADWRGFLIAHARDLHGCEHQFGVYTDPAGDGLRAAAQRMVTARDAYLASIGDDGPEGHELDEAHDALRAALATPSSDAAYATGGNIAAPSDSLDAREQGRLACTCGHPFISHTEYGCADCGTANRDTPQHNFQRTSRAIAAAPRSET